MLASELIDELQMKVADEGDHEVLDSSGLAITDVMLDQDDETGATTSFSLL